MSLVDVMAVHVNGLLHCGKDAASRALGPMLVQHLEQPRERNQVEPGSQAAQGIKGPLPPHGQIFDFLPAADRDALLDWALGEGENFKPAKIFYGEGGQGSRTDPEVRQALRHSGVGPFEPMLRDRLLEALPQIMAAAGYRGRSRAHSSSS
jgi:hypothetical protein